MRMALLLRSQGVSRPNAMTISSQGNTIATHMDRVPLMIRYPSMEAAKAVGS